MATDSAAAIRLSDMPMMTPEFIAFCESMNRDAHRSRLVLGMVRGGNARHVGVEGPYRLPAIIKLPDGSAAAVSAGFLNDAVKHNGHYHGPPPPHPPEQIFGCPVIAMGWHDSEHPSTEDRK